MIADNCLYLLFFRAITSCLPVSTTPNTDIIFNKDGILKRIFDVILPQPINQNLRYCVDVGAWDGRHLSNTFSLLVAPSTSQPDINLDNTSSSCAWKGILIEACSTRFQELRSLHEPLKNICVNTTVSSDPSSKDSLVSILQREAAELPMDFDFLCVDVDGSDYWLLQEVFEHNYRPKVVCIEFNPTMPNDLICTSPFNLFVKNAVISIELYGFIKANMQVQVV